MGVALMIADLDIVDSLKARRTVDSYLRALSAYLTDEGQPLLVRRLNAHVLAIRSDAVERLPRHMRQAA